ncbi:hypothetical protein AXF42_Ash016341 [Apostasia shenzhenica]|uniref:Uncharacterized protein n=1 Tax=Apostasia shenzhenica TaxID=1088818 RepID=A0A2H9ZXH6_9ASPA|nr:hypothetical protein AXF42_Ash016341 [Apostasia shenzhenica]
MEGLFRPSYLFLQKENEIGRPMRHPTDRWPLHPFTSKEAALSKRERKRGEGAPGPSSLVGLSHPSILHFPIYTTMNELEEENPFCYIHPKEFVVGVCALCLKERLLGLASKQGYLPLPKDASRSFRFLKKKPSIALTRVFAFRSLLLQRSDSRTRKSDDECDGSSISSPEDSFISMKIEADGNASLESKRTASFGLPWISTGRSEDMAKGPNRRAVVEHVKPRGSLRWRKRIGQLLQLARWKRSSKAGAAHAGFSGMVEGSRRRERTRSLTRRRATP